MMSATQNHGGSRSEDRLLSAILVLAICLTLAPVLRLFVEGVTDQGSPSLGLMRDVLAQPSTLSALKHSLFTAGFGTLVSLVLGSAFAFLVALTDLRAKAALVFCLMIPMMIPPQITALSWTQIMGPSSYQRSQRFADVVAGGDAADAAQSGGGHGDHFRHRAGEFRHTGHAWHSGGLCNPAHPCLSKACRNGDDSSR